ncbi:PREDICTED: uncharacterized protein LOC104606219 isoform X2 [Nelumbo nucifera]|uniref:Trimethylguanosine synthase n=1 Tax=Nelumbo nucifera TaxID=4432 RepID=A0A1U8APU0_NELNU|nr:PREDICTED: uncharacterized protein LOC104606219 isoform X2 [Nelumbo nucifera]
MEAEAEVEAPAIRALGFLFKLTEVFLWTDDAPIDETEVSASFVRQGNLAETAFSSCQGACSSEVESTVNDYTPSEDMELIRQMNDLGLPVSFGTNKEKRATIPKGKRKSARMKPLSGHNKNERELEVSRKSEVLAVSTVALHDNTNITLCGTRLDQSETSYYDIAEGIDEHHYPSGDSSSLTAIISSSIAQEQTSGELSGETANLAMDSDTISSSIVPKYDSKVGVHSVTLNTEASPENVPQNTAFELDEEMDKRPAECKNSEGSFMAYYDREGGNLCVDIRAEQVLISEPAVSSDPSSDMFDHVKLSCKSFGNLEDWTVIWDSFYMRNYFYNNKTHESTWYPPPGMEHLAFSDSASTEMTVNTAEGEVGPLFSCDHIKTSTLCGSEDKTDLLEKVENEDKLSSHPLCEVSYELEPAAGDFVSSMSPPTVSCSSGHLDELVGLASCFETNGNFAKVPVSSSSDPQNHIYSLTTDLTKAVSEEACTSNTQVVHVTSATVELDSQHNPVIAKRKKKVRRSRSQRKILSDNNEVSHCQVQQKNALLMLSNTGVKAIYGVDGGIDFILGDYFQLAPKLKADTVFLSPPWGGPDYARVQTYDIKTMLKPCDGHFLFNTARRIASRVVMFLPRNVDLNQLAELSLSAQPPWTLEVEKNFLNGRLKAITAYFSNTQVRESEYFSHSDKFSDNLDGLRYL